MQSTHLQDLPITDLPPAVLTALSVNRDAHIGAFLAMVLDLCQRRVLQVQVQVKEGHHLWFWKTRRNEFYLGLRDGYDEAIHEVEEKRGSLWRWPWRTEEVVTSSVQNTTQFMPWEQRLLSSLSVNVKLGYEGLHGHKDIRDRVATDLGEYLHLRGFFLENPVQHYKDTGGVRSLEAAIWAVVSFAGLMIITIMLSTWDLGQWTVLLVMSAMFGTFFLIKSIWEVIERGGQVEPTTAGIGVINQWKPFLILVKSEKLFPDKVTFERYLPYTIAFGVSDKWVRCAEKAGAYSGVLYVASGEVLFNSKSELQDFLCDVGRCFGFAEGEAGYTCGKGYDDTGAD